MKNFHLSKLALVLFGFLFTISAAFAYPERQIGIGVGIQHNDQRQIVVISVAPRSPAQRVNILPGDLILSVDGIQVTGHPLDYVESLLIGNGVEGSFITLDVRTPSSGEERTIHTQRRWTDSGCLVEGPYDLRFGGSLYNGSLWGSIGYASVHWPIYQGRIQEWIGGRYSRLDIYPVAYSNDLEVSGWIGSSYIRWRSRGAWFNGYQPCVRP